MKPKAIFDGFPRTMELLFHRRRPRAARSLMTSPYGPMGSMPAEEVEKAPCPSWGSCSADGAATRTAGPRAPAQSGHQRRGELRYHLDYDTCFMRASMS